MAEAGGAGAPARADAPEGITAFCRGWLLAGALGVAIAVIQVFLPDWPDGQWIAASGTPGRAVGNLRQPNHLSSLLLWAAIGAVALLEMRRLGRRAVAAALALLVFAVVLTASRTGLVSVLLLAFWGAADRRLARFTRVLLLAAPLVYAVAWLGMAQWAAASSHAFGGAARLAESDISGSRFGIWANTLEHVAAIEADLFFGLAQRGVDRGGVGLFHPTAGEADLAGVVVEVVGPARQKDRRNLTTRNQRH